MERKILARWKVGSHLYGLQRPESDQDFMGIFMPTPEDMLGLVRKDTVDESTKSDSEDRRNTKDDIDDKYYSLNRFVELLIKNNPNIVEVLFATPENVIATSKEWEELVDNKDKFISKNIFNTFTGYATTQKKKMLVKRERYTSLVAGVKYMEENFTESLIDSKAAFTEDDAVVLNKILKYYKGSKHNCESFHSGMPIKVVYEKLVAERDNYGWRVKTDTFDTLGYDVKFAYHLIRILAEGAMLLKTGSIDYPLSGSIRKDIVDIREGKVEFDSLMNMYYKYEDRCKEAIKITILPDKADEEWANNWLIEKLHNYYQKR